MAKSLHAHWLVCWFDKEDLSTSLVVQANAVHLSCL
jgi:hypothetical protein